MAQSVHKFGGSSLSHASRYHAVANIIQKHCQLGDVVVVSAAGKTTDTLVKLWDCYQAADKQGVADVITLLSQHQLALIAELLEQECVSAMATLEQELSEIAQQIAQNTLEEAWLLAHGELWSARLLAQYLNQRNLNALNHDARTLITFVNGEINHAHNRSLCQKLSLDAVNVVTGFIASNELGDTVTLGRNGSDYSATLLAKYCISDSVTIWTDTQGIFSTDPRKVEKAAKYNKVCRDQAHLLARLGNPVLHAKTLSPLRDTLTKLVVRSSYDSHSDGTEVVAKGSAKQKRFITNIADYDLLKIEQFDVSEVSEISLALQHPLHHFSDQGEDFILVSAELSSRLSELLTGRARLIASRVSGVAVVCEQGVEESLLAQTKGVLLEQSIQPRVAFSAQGYAIVLSEQVLDSDVLTLLHESVISVGQEIAIVVAGLGNVGTVFLEQLKSQVVRLNQLLPVKLVGLLRSQKMHLDCQGVEIEDWQQQFEQFAKPIAKDELMGFIDGLDYEHKVVIDITASESFSHLYCDFALRDCHLISANKFAGTASYDWYCNLQHLLNEKGLLWRYNTSVGAGLPVNFCLADLQNSGDQIEQLSGVFSGTLSWLGSHYDGSRPFSQLMLEAKELGYTEPDPREDLSGRDVQRKLLILARDLGLTLDLEDIKLTPWMPEHLAQGDWQSFLSRLDELDKYVEDLLLAAKKQGKVLRYVAELNLVDESVVAEVGLKAVAPDAVVATLKAGDNIFVINSRWYKDNALVIQGPGAGKEVTAAGVHSDLYWLCHYLV